MDDMYENYHWWRKIWYYCKKFQRVLMTNWNKIKFYSFEYTLEIVNKTKFKNITRIKSHKSLA